MLSDLGRLEEALAATGEAVEIQRRTAAARPDIFAINLAESLINLREATLRGDYQAADTPYRQSLTTAQRLGNQAGIATSH